MPDTALFSKIHTLLLSKVIFGGLTKDKQVVLECDLETLSLDLADLFIQHLENISLREVRKWLKELIT